jgi:hypothetical protein
VLVRQADALSLEPHPQHCVMELRLPNLTNHELNELLLFINYSTAERRLRYITVLFSSWKLKKPIYFGNNKFI